VGGQSPHQNNCVYLTPLVRSESNEVFFQTLARRSRYSIWPLKFECDCFLTQNAFWGSGTARHLGPTPRGRLKFCRMLACRTRTARNRRVKDARRSVTGPLSAALPRDICGLAILTFGKGLWRGVGEWPLRGLYTDERACIFITRSSLVS